MKDLTKIDHIETERTRSSSKLNKKINKAF